MSCTITYKNKQLPQEQFVEEYIPQQGDIIEYEEIEYMVHDAPILGSQLLNWEALSEEPYEITDITEQIADQIPIYNLDPVEEAHKMYVGGVMPIFNIPLTTLLRNGFKKTGKKFDFEKYKNAFGFGHLMSNNELYFQVTPSSIFQREAQVIFDREVRGKKLDKNDVDRINRILSRASSKFGDVSWHLVDGPYGYYIAGYKGKSVTASYYDSPYISNIYKQLEGVPSSITSTETIVKVKEAAKKMGIDVQKLSDYIKAHPEINTKGANAVADLVRGIIAISEGKENIALTEEMVHVATAILEQTHPSLITEMISKIGRFKIYNQTLEAYKNNPNYKTPDGKPDIRKIKKEAVDKLIAELIINQNDGTTDFPELMEETNRSWVRNLWNSILDTIRGMYRKSNISIFEEVAGKVIAGEIEGNVENVPLEGIYMQLSDKQKDLQKRIMDTQATVVKRTAEEEKVDPILLDTEEASNWYEIQKPDGTWERVKKRVTDRVKDWFKSRFPGKRFTEQEKIFNETKRELGILGHSYFQEIHGRYFNPDGTRKTAVTPRSVKLSARDEAIYNKLEKYFVDLISRFSRDGKNPLVFAEVVVYDKKEKEAGTIDLLVVEENGKANIIDWKFMSIRKADRDIPAYKQGAYNIQLKRYKEILIDNYGVKEIGMDRAVPILMNIERENAIKKDSPMILKGITVGSVDTSTIEDLRLVPVSEETETTGHSLSGLSAEGAEKLDRLIEELNTVSRQIQKKTATSDEEQEFKSRRVRIIKEAIRMIQGTQNIAPLISVISSLKEEGQMILNDYKTIYEGKPVSEFKDKEKQLSDFSNEMREYNSVADIFGKAPRLIGSLIYTPQMEEEAETEEELREVKERKEILDKIKVEAEEITNSMDEIKAVSMKFADKFIGEKNLTKGLLNPEPIIKGLSATFSGISQIPNAAEQILFKVVTNAKGRAVRTAIDEVKELMSIREKLSKRGGDLRKLVQQIYQKDDKDKLVNKLIHMYDREFWNTIDENARQDIPSRKVLDDNIDIAAYKEEAIKHMNDQIASIKARHKGDPDLMKRLIEDEQRKWDIDNPEFEGWNNYIIKRHPLEKWYSKEYLELQKDPELLELYHFITKMNERAKDSGYIQSKIASTFLPFVRKSMAESLSWDLTLSAISHWGNSLTLKADDVGYGAINELTHEMDYSIPKYYTYDFTRTEDGENDYSDVSEDLFKNMILYINHMENYKYMLDVEGQLLLVKDIESFKDHYQTSKTGEVIFVNGKPQIEKGNEDNTKTFDDYLRGVFYEQRYPLTEEDMPLNIGVKRKIMKAINKVAGHEVFEIDEEPSAISLVKAIDVANRGFQLKTLGLEFMSGAVNSFGNLIQISTQAGNYFKAREVAKNINRILADKFQNGDERKMFIQLVEKFMPLKDDPTYDELQKAGLGKLTQINFSDNLMFFMRKPEELMEKSIFMTLLQNMMIENGHIVSIREYVKKKYPERFSSPLAYRESKNEIDREIDELKRTRSIDATKKLEDGKVVIPGLDMNDFNELQRLTKLARMISRNATGGISDSDRSRASMNIWLKSALVFKTWIPKLVATRFSHFERVGDDFSVRIDDEGHTEGEKYDIGRVRLMFYVLASDGILKGISNIRNILQVNEEGLAKIDKMYEDFAEQYRKRTGREMDMDRNDFIDLIRTNLYNQMKELGMLASLFGAMLAMGFMVPPDDADKATKNFYRWSQRIVDKFTSELLFFYNPAEFQRLLSGGAFPAIGLLNDMEKFVYHFSMEVTGMDLTNPTLTYDEVVKKAMPTKYLFKALPVTKSVMTYMAIFDSDFAKEFDITIQKQNNLR